MNKLTFKLLIGSFVAIGAAAFSLGVIHELRTIKNLTTDADNDEADAKETSEASDDETTEEEIPASEPVVEEQLVEEGAAE